MFEKLKNKIAKFKPSNVILCDQSNLIVIKISKLNLKEMVSFIKKDENCKFTVLTDLTAVDYPDRDKRFEIIYNFLSLQENLRLIIKLDIADGDDIETISDIHNSAVWYEREVWDLFGIQFNNHPDMRRLLTDYGFVGHPLRKDFPLTGYKEVRYDFEQQKVIYEPVTLTQDYRSFDFISPWEGTNYALPGDEKAKK